MIRKLRRKIVYINVILVSVVLIFVFTVMCVNSYSSAKSELMRSLRGAAEFDAVSVSRTDQTYSDSTIPRDAQQKLYEGRPIGQGNDMASDKDAPKYTAKYVLAELDSECNIVSSRENGASISDSVLKSSLSAIEKLGSQSGIIASQGIAYYRIMLDGGGSVVVLADTEIITSAVQSSLITAVSLYAVSIAVLIVISILLAHLAVRPIEQAWQQQKQFVADASHELKTPLTVILANNGILLSHRDDMIENQSRWLDSTQEEAEHMKGLIDRMLTLAKSDGEQLSPVAVEFDLGELAEGCALYFEPIAYEKSVTVVCEHPERAIVTSDKAMVTQLAQILIDNAVKYSAASSEVKIKVCTSPYTELSVINLGEPISEEDRQHIFDRFYRADKARDKSGYGLGLSIAKSIAEALRLSITVTSSDEGETVFRVRFRSHTP